ncbi:DegT/DnrJ/EryC1/StrS family aminotransferase [Candidatus Woesearchaeota archaeon]|nr:DegT/DnrJ/EryC1/StrS family aminotransferase [Candidatus Woesearchaeota archaeon]
MEIIPLAKPYIGNEEIEAVCEVLKSGCLSLGPKLEEFEERFAKFVGVRYAIAVSSGTTGLHLCMANLNLKQGDEVITTPLSFVASANCILYMNAKPVFVDIDPLTLNIDPKKIENAITSKTKAILIVHIFGMPCDMDPIIEIAKKYNLLIIEDACEALGAEYKGKKVGTFGLASVFAFYPNKQITTGEGGMICTNSQEIYTLCKSLRNQGRPVDSSWLVHERVGFNYRLNEISCSLGIEQLKKVELILKKREIVAETYNQLLDGTDGVVIPYKSDIAKRSWFIYFIILSEYLKRDELSQKLDKKGIKTKPYLPCIHLQPAYVRLFGYKKGDFPVCEKISEHTLALPFFTDMNKETIEKVCSELKREIKDVFSTN